MSVRRLEPGQVIGGFKLEAPVHIGAMAKLWRVAGADAALPLLMKIPLLRHGENRVPAYGAISAVCPRAWSRRRPAR